MPPLLHGVGADVTDWEEYPVSRDGLEGEVTLAPWEFWIAAEK